MKNVFILVCLMISFPLMGQVKIVRDVKTNKVEIQIGRAHV